MNSVTWVLDARSGTKLVKNTQYINAGGGCHQIMKMLLKKIKNKLYACIIALNAI